MDSLSRIAEILRKEIERNIHAGGVLSRVFARGKSEISLKRKIESSPGKYSVGGNLIQDGVGIRVVVYFPDDMPLIEEMLKGRYDYYDEASSIDDVDESTFNVIRRNLMFKLPEDERKEFDRSISKTAPLDSTFEVQLRSVLSEGWHEVEHDMRYKCQKHWSGFSDLNRALNGLMATLETSEWSMLKVFDELAFRHYRNKNWGAMLHAKFRLRVEPKLSEQLDFYFNRNNEIAKTLFRYNRGKLLRQIYLNRLSFPILLDNIVFFWNYLDLKDQQILDMTPEPLVETFSEVET